eukprot:jgi/Antlo1/1776/2356
MQSGYLAKNFTLMESSVAGRNTGPLPRKKEEAVRPRVPRQQDKEWVPTTDLGILVKMGKINMEDIFQYSLKIKESGIVDHLLKGQLKEEVIKIKSVQKQTRAGQRTRMKVVVVVGNGAGYVGIGTKTSKEAATAIKGAIERAKCAIRPVRLGFWGNNYGKEHTVPCKATGKSGSVIMRVIPAPKGSGIRAGSVPKKIFQLAGVKDVFTLSKGQTSTTENFAKATVSALDKSSCFFVPEFWREKEPELNPLSRYSRLIKEYREKIARK